MGDYVRLDDELRPENFGKGLAARKMLDTVCKLHPDVQERLSQSPAIADVVRAMAERDNEFVSQHGLKQRPDIQKFALGHGPARLEAASFRHVESR